MTIKQQTDKTGSRKYTTAEGRSYPSVTTILSKFESKAWLKTWKENNPNHKELSNKYATIGTRVHSFNEQLLLNGTVDFSKIENNEKIPEDNVKEIKARHYSYIPFLAHVKAIAVEEKLIWERYVSNSWVGFGGTTDLIGYIEDPSFLKEIYKENNALVTTDIFKKNEPMFIVSDYKNWSSAKQPDRCIKHFCQLAAYAAAKNEGLSAANKIRHGILLGTTCSEKTKKSNLFIYYLNLEELDFYFTWFYQFVQAYHGLIPKEKANWNLFKEIACGYKKIGVDDETGKAIWGDRDRDYLGKKLIISA